MDFSTTGKFSVDLYPWAYYSLKISLPNGLVRLFNIWTYCKPEEEIKREKKENYI